MIKFSLPTWLDFRAETSADFERQLQHAREDCTAFAASRQAAQDAYDTEPSQRTEDALVAAEEAERRGQIRLARAERKLAVARERDERDKRERLEARVSEIEKLLSAEAVQELVRPLDEREAQLLANVAALRADRVKLAQELNGLGRERAGLLERLGRAPLRGVVVADGRATLHQDEYADRGRFALHESGVHAVLKGKLTELSADDPRREPLQRILAEIGTNVPVHDAGPGPQTRAAERAAAAIALAGRGGAA